jgi:DNA helicase-2/ATP-dependent DNA helicase PcrA
MDIAPELENLDEYLELNENQSSIVAHDSGPLLVIAGPGSGKTRSLILLAMNLLLLDRAKPAEIILCTYTEKAAYEMQDRIFDLAKKVNYRRDISQMRIGTIHSICNRLIIEHLHRVEMLGNNYETLDELPQRLLIFEWMDEICKPDPTFFMNRWGTTRWKTAKKLQSFFDKITEELIDINSLISSRDRFLVCIANTYHAYQKMLIVHNHVDFAHLQKIVYGLLRNPSISQHITKGIRYVLVDEYQDTNYIQEQILIKLASETRNICVVGDEDQSLYRFRGATVQNIREFRDHFPECKRIYLTMNYRSHPKIIAIYNRWILSINWSHAGCTFRSDKTIQHIPDKTYPEYPATLSISGKDVYEEAELFAEFVTFLKEQGIITDYNQVALLLYSVKTYKSDVYVQALERKGISVFCPRAGTYFIQDEVCLIVGCFTRIFGYHNQGRGNFIEYEPMSAYLNECVTSTATRK